MLIGEMVRVEVYRLTGFPLYSIVEGFYYLVACGCEFPTSHIEESIRERDLA
jgi:hypothetical protein